MPKIFKFRYLKSKKPNIPFADVVLEEIKSKAREGDLIVYIYSPKADLFEILINPSIEEVRFHYSEIRKMEI